MLSSVNANVTGVRHRVSARQSPSSRTLSLSRFNKIHDKAISYTTAHYSQKENSYASCSNSNNNTSRGQYTSDERFAGFHTPQSLRA